MMTIHLHKLRFHAFHGIYAEEKVLGGEFEVNLSVNYTPKRKMVGYGVDRVDVDLNYPRFFVSYSQGLKGVFNSDFNYSKLQLYYRQPLLIGGFGRLFSTLEIGKTFGTVPLSDDLEQRSQRR